MSLLHYQCFMTLYCIVHIVHVCTHTNMCIISCIYMYNMYPIQYYYTILYHIIYIYTSHQQYTTSSSRSVYVRKSKCSKEIERERERERANIFTDTLSLSFLQLLLVVQCTICILYVVMCVVQKMMMKSIKQSSICK